NFLKRTFSSFQGIRISEFKGRAVRWSENFGQDRAQISSSLLSHVPTRPAVAPLTRGHTVQASTTVSASAGAGDDASQGLVLLRYASQPLRTSQFSGTSPFSCTDAALPSPKP
uniref:Uncharacterized protein n=1 Tax=Aegilops tauschii subsp. strangulata TaxID=200361 RepID=A0A453K764_AEGTS